MATIKRSQAQPQPQAQPQAQAQAQASNQVLLQIQKLEMEKKKIELINVRKRNYLWDIAKANLTDVFDIVQDPDPNDPDVVKFNTSEEFMLACINHKLICPFSIFNEFILNKNVPFKYGGDYAFPLTVWTKYEETLNVLISTVKSNFGKSISSESFVKIIGAYIEKLNDDYLKAQNEELKLQIKNDDNSITFNMRIITQHILIKLKQIVNSKMMKKESKMMKKEIDGLLDTLYCNVSKKMIYYKSRDNKKVWCLSYIPAEYGYGIPTPGTWRWFEHKLNKYGHVQDIDKYLSKHGIMIPTDIHNILIKLHKNTDTYKIFFKYNHNNKYRRGNKYDPVHPLSIRCIGIKQKWEKKSSI